MNNNTEGSGFYVVSSFMADGTAFFSGMMFYSDSIIIGEKGFKEYLQFNDFPDMQLAIEGRFSLVKLEDDFVYASTDLFGQEAIYYYAQDGVWGISNSFLLLCRELKSRGINLTLDYDQASILKIKHGFTQQLISNDTLINEIKVSPREKILIINKTNTKTSFIDINTESRGQGSYEDDINNFLNRNLEINLALTSYFKNRVTVDITGGVDSRLVLATLIDSGVDLSTINFVCAKGANNDYYVASLLADEFNFKITNKSFTYGQGTQEELYDFWKLGNIGVYYPIYFPSSVRPQSLLHYHGACGECYRDFYGMSAKDYLEEIASSQKDQKALFSLNRKFGKTLHDSKVAVDSKLSMFHHYKDFRSRFHFGRSAFRNLNEYTVTSLSSPHLLYAFNKLDDYEKENGSLVLDIFLASCPNILNIPFDEDSKNFEIKEIESSRFYSLKRKKNLHRNLKIYYCLEPREPKTESNQSINNYLIYDLEKYQDSLIKSNFYSCSEIELMIDLIKSGRRVTLIGLDAAKMISLGEVLSICNEMN